MKSIRTKLVRCGLQCLAALVGTLASPAFTTAQAVESLRLRVFEQHALTHAGDVRQGRALFLDEMRTKCVTCHRVGQMGGQLGPDLSSIGGKFDRTHLIESLLEPSRQIVDGYRTTILETIEGRILHGIVKERSNEQVTLVDTMGHPHVLLHARIAALADSPVSTMPVGLIDSLSREQFTDVIAYLETLRPNGDAKFGAGVTGPISVPDGFEVCTIATGLTGATALEVFPDGRVLVSEQPGSVRIVEHDRLLNEPFHRLPVAAEWERGLLGVTVDPEFPQQPYVYVCWVASEPYPHHRVSRFVAQGNSVEPDSELTLLTGDDQQRMGGKIPAGHQGSALHFGSDRKLYVSLGDQTAGEPAQALDSLLGKLLRINRDGTIPDDNPFVNQTSGKYRAIWARGLRNPFTFAIDRASGFMLVNDVGGNFEEVNVGIAGGNYGWPAVEHGPSADNRYLSPIHWYPQSSIAGADFVPAGSTWPPAFQGRYFFADFVQGWIKTLDPRGNSPVETFATGLRRPVDLRFTSDGRLYVLVRNAWVIDEKFTRGTGSLLEIRPVPQP